MPVYVELTSFALHASRVYSRPHLALAPGTRLGVYEITAQIGEGGPPPLACDAGELRRGLAVARRSQVR